MSSTRNIAFGMAVVVLTVLSAPPHSDAGQKGRGPQTTTPPKPSTPKGQSVKANGPSSAGAASATKTTGGKPTSTGHGAGKTVTTSNTTTTSVSTTTKGPRSTSTINFTPTNAVASKVATKPQLMDKLATRFPGADLNLMTADFKNFGQFVAALNVSQNLGIPFADLKAAMTGTTIEGVDTGKPTLSLGQAIQQLKPGVDADAEVQLATKQAGTLDAPASLDTTQTTTVAKRPKSTQSASR